jgi:hypothetical protein
MAMKKLATLVALALLTLYAVIAVFLHGLSPVTVIENVSGSPVNVRLETDVGESYEAGTIPSGGAARMKISGQDKLIWAVAKFSDGHVAQSKQIYTTTQGTLSVRVGNNAVEVDYRL